VTEIAFDVGETSRGFAATSLAYSAAVGAVAAAVLVHLTASVASKSDRPLKVSLLEARTIGAWTSSPPPSPYRWPCCCLPSPRSTGPDRPPPGDIS
jgi:hypothetical protein